MSMSPGDFALRIDGADCGVRVCSGIASGDVFEMLAGTMCGDGRGWYGVFGVCTLPLLVQVALLSLD